MPYSNSLTLLETEGGQSLTLDVTARLWMLWTTVGTGSGSGNQQSEQDSMDGAASKSGTPMPVFFNRDADFTYASRSVGISIQDKNLVGQDRGWLFRSGSFPATLPTESIDIVTGKKDITDAELQTMLPALPFTIDASTSITGLTAMLAAGGIDVTATGTTTKTGVIVGFRYTGRLLIEPSSDIAAAPSEAISVGISNPVIVFLPGPSVLSAIEADLLNLLRVFIMHDLGPQFRNEIEKRLNVELVAGLGRQLPGQVLPEGVILSVRTVNINTERISVRAALGAFGGVISKFPKNSNSNPIKCFIATAVYGANSREVEVLRMYRDFYLLTNRLGRRVVELYEYVSPPMAKFISNKPALRRLTRIIIVHPFFWIAKQIMDRRLEEN